MANLLVIRSDAGEGIGTGHLMRCLAVAGAWRTAGGRVVLLTSRLPASLYDRACHLGLEVIPITGRHPDPADLRQTLVVLETLRQGSEKSGNGQAGLAGNEPNPRRGATCRGFASFQSRTPRAGLPRGETNRLKVSDEANSQPGSGGSPAENSGWLLLDGYHFDTAYQQAVREAGFYLAVIDDWNHLPHYEADLLLNHQAGADGTAYNIAPETSLLLGPRFVLLRGEFAGPAPAAEDDPPLARNILITLGGEDPTNATQRVTEALGRLDLPEYEARVVLGPASQQREALRRLLAGMARPETTAPSAGADHPAETPSRIGCAEERWRVAPGRTVVLLSDVSQMAELMRWAHVALSAAGTTCWELARVGVPTVMVGVAENQYRTAPALAEATGFVYLGAMEHLSADAIARCLERLCRDVHWRRAARETASRLVDGRGAERVVRIMRAISGQLDPDALHLGPMQPEHRAALWRLANEPAVRRNSLSSHPIAWEEHCAWFADRLASSTAALWAAEYAGVLVGSVRYELRSREAVLSVAVHPAFRGRGVARRLVEQTWETSARRLGADKVIAEVRSENAASMRLLAALGFRSLGPAVVRGQQCVIFERRLPRVCHE